MLNMEITDDARAIMLLCGRFGSKSATADPLNIRDYNKLVNWLREHMQRPGDLIAGTALQSLKKDPGGLDVPRYEALLNRGAAMALSVEKWNNKGIWVLCRSDARYPNRMKEHLKASAPALIYGVGNPSLLSDGGVAVIGSREVDGYTESYTREFGEYCGSQAVPIISGGARGVDETAMLAAVGAGGIAVGVLANDLLKSAVSKKYRQALVDDQLVLISPYNPDARFSVGTAMGRNKHIYSLADYALVVSSGLKGGTWSGATEELKRDNAIRMFVRKEGPLPEGNEKLISKGSHVMPSRPWETPLKTMLSRKGRSELHDKQGFSAVKLYTNQKPACIDARKVVEEKSDSPGIDPQTAMYRTFVRILPEVLLTPMSQDDIAAALSLQKGQAKEWLKQAHQDGLLKKLNKPVRYTLDPSSQHEFDAL